MTKVLLEAFRSYSTLAWAVCWMLGAFTLRRAGEPEGFLQKQSAFTNLQLLAHGWLYKDFFFLITLVRRAVWLTDLLKPRDHSAEMKGKKGTRKLSEIFSSLFVEKVEKLLDQNSIPS